MISRGHGQDHYFARGNLGFVLDMIYFVRGEGKGMSVLRYYV